MPKVREIEMSEPAAERASKHSMSVSLQYQAKTSGSLKKYEVFKQIPQRASETSHHCE
jgi:hypothetical protein